MKNILTIALCLLAVAACTRPDVKTKQCLTFDDDEIVCVDDHVGKDGIEEVKADLHDAVNAL